MATWVLIDTHAVTPNMHEQAVEVEADTPQQAVAAVTGCSISDLGCEPYGPAPDVFCLWPKPGSLAAADCQGGFAVIAVKRDV